MNVILHNIGPV